MGRIVVLGVFHDPVLTDWMEPLLKEQSFIFSVCYGIMDGRHDFEMAIDSHGVGQDRPQTHGDAHISANGDAPGPRHRLRQDHRLRQSPAADVTCKRPTVIPA